MAKSYDINGKKVKVKDKNKNSTRFNVVAMTIIIIHLCLIYIPVLWGIAQSIKPRIEFMTDRIGLPMNPTFEHYGTVFQYFTHTIVRNGRPTTIYFEEMIWNTVLFAGGTSFFSFVATSFIAYIIYRYRRFKASGVIFTVLLLALNISIQGSTASALALYHSIGVYDNMIAFWLLSFHPLNFYFLVYHAGYKSIPDELYEAAEVDGANRLMLYFKIGLPLVKGVTLLFILSSFIGAWNNYATNLTWLPSYPFVGYGLYLFNIKTTPPVIAHSSVKLAAAFVAAMPMLVVLAIFGNKMMKGVTISGGIKG